MINANLNLNFTNGGKGIRFPDCVIQAIAYSKPIKINQQWYFKDLVGKNNVLITYTDIALFNVNDYVNTNTRLTGNSFNLKLRAFKYHRVNIGQGSENFRTGVKWDLDNTIYVYISNSPTVSNAYGRSGVIDSSDFANIEVIYNGLGSTNEDKLKLFVNKVEQPLTFNGTIPTSINSDNNLLIGAGYNLGDYSFCMIDEVEFNQTKYLFCEAGGNILYDVYKNSNGTIFTSDIINFWSKSDHGTPDTLINGFDLWENETSIIYVPYDSSKKPILTSGDILSNYAWKNTFPSGAWHNKSSCQIQQPVSDELLACDTNNFYYEFDGTPIPITYNQIVANFNNYIFWNTRGINRKQKGILIRQTCQPLSEEDKCLIKSRTDTGENLDNFDPLQYVCKADRVIGTWGERQWNSYVSIHGGTYSNSIRDEFINRCSPTYQGTGYYYNTYGPEGLNKEVADWILMFYLGAVPIVNSDKIIYTGERGGLNHQKRWNINGVIHTSGVPTNFGLTTITGTIFNKAASKLYVKNMNFNNIDTPNSIIYFSSISCIPFKPVGTDASKFIINNIVNNTETIDYNFIDWEESDANCNITISNNLNSSTTLIKNISDTFFKSFVNQKLLNISFKDLQLNRSQVDNVLKKVNEYFLSDFTEPVTGLTINLTGINMSSPTGGVNNPDYISLVNRFYEAGYSLVILINN